MSTSLRSRGIGKGKMQFFRGLTRKKQSSSEERRKKEQDCYLKNGSCVLEELLALCDGNCRIPIRYFTAIEIERAIKHSKSRMGLSDVDMVTGSLDNRLVFVRFNRCQFNNIHRDIAVTAQMSHMKNVLRLVGCCLEFEEAVMVYEYVEGISLRDLLFKKANINDHARKSSLTWGNRLRIAKEVASAIVFLHTEFTTPIIHRDIKPSKVIIDENSGVAKIVDFSWSISLPPGKLEIKSKDGMLGTIGYIAPENGFYNIITQKIDVYSFGVLLFELLTGKTTVDIVDSAISEETIDFEEGTRSNIEERNNMDSVDSAIPIFENHPPNIVDRYIREGYNVINIADPIIFEERGIDIQQQLEDYLDLVKRCTSSKAEDRPYMIHVAKELRRIDNCYRALTIGQN